MARFFSLSALSSVRLPLGILFVISCLCNSIPGTKLQHSTSGTMFEQEARCRETYRSGGEGNWESSDITGHPARPCKANWQPHLPVGCLKAEICLNQKLPSKHTWTLRRVRSRLVPAGLQTLIRDPPLGLESICIPRRPIDWPLLSRVSTIFYPVTRSWACRRRPTHLGLFVSLSRDIFLSSGSSAKQFFRRGGGSAWLNGV